MSTTPDPLTLSISSDVGDIANAVTEAGKIAAQIQSELNTPAEIDAKVRQEKQDRIDAINRAIESGDLDALRKLSSP